jgi:hypothetical protein
VREFLKLSRQSTGKDHVAAQYRLLHFNLNRGRKWLYEGEDRLRAVDTYGEFAAFEATLAHHHPAQEDVSLTSHPPENELPSAISAAPDKYAKLRALIAAYVVDKKTMHEAEAHQDSRRWSVRCTSATDSSQQDDDEE